MEHIVWGLLRDKLSLKRILPADVKNLLYAYYMLIIPNWATLAFIYVYIIYTNVKTIKCLAQYDYS